MPPHRITRRKALKAAAAFGSALATIPTAMAAPSETHRLTIGMATFGFGALTNSQLAEEMSAAGVKTVQLFLSQSDSRY